jgi:hypothetical protein
MGTCGGPILIDQHGLCEDCSDASPQEVLLRFHQRDTSGAGVYTTVLLTPHGEVVDWELHCERLARYAAPYARTSIVGLEVFGGSRSTAGPVNPWCDAPGAYS